MADMASVGYVMRFVRREVLYGIEMCFGRMFKVGVLSISPRRDQFII